MIPIFQTIGSFIDFQSDPRVSDNFRNIINQLLYIIDQSSSYEEYLQQLTALAATINLDTLSADDRIKYQLYSSSLNVNLMIHFALLKSECGGTSWPRGPNRKEIRCGVSIIGGAILGGLSGAWIGAVAGAATGWATGPCE
ncbi:MAG: hypothetical protein IPP37_17425 [Saprospiraceae bacterium]|nr:hypothetical protein [Saprospiraceae bacterium]